MLHYRYLDCGTLILISNCLHYFSKVCRFLFHLNFTPNLSYFCKNRGFSPSIPPTFTAVMRLFIIRAWYALFHNSQFEINRFHRSLSSSIGQRADNTIVLSWKTLVRVRVPMWSIPSILFYFSLTLFFFLVRFFLSDCSD